MSFASTVLALSPYGWWRCGDLSGTVLTDSSGNGRNGIIHPGTISYNQVALTSDSEPSLLLSANSSWLTALSGSAGAPGVANAAFTMIWIYRPTALSNTFMVGGGGGTGGFNLNQTGTGLNLFGGPTRATLLGSCTNAAANIVANGNPVLIRITYDGINTWKVCINGSATPVITNTTTVLTPGTANLVQFGTSSNGAASSYGYYQDCMVFNYVVADADWANIYSTAGLTSFVTLTSTLTTVNNPTTVVSSWTAASGGTGPYSYKLYRGETSQIGVFGYTQIYSGALLTFTDTPPDGNLKYYRLSITDSLANQSYANLVPGQLSPALCICAIGDSRTAGAGATPGTNDLVTQLGTTLTNILQPINVTTVNQGQNGSKTSDWLTGGTYMTNALAAFNTAAAALPAGSKVYVIIMLGVNDSDSSSPISLATYLANLRNMIAGIKAAALPNFAGIILNTSFYSVPYGYSGLYTENSNALMLQYNAALPSLCDNATVFMGDKESYDFFALKYGTDLFDLLHPNPAGYTALSSMQARPIINLYTGSSSGGGGGNSTRLLTRY